MSRGEHRQWGSGQWVIKNTNYEEQQAVKKICSMEGREDKLQQGQGSHEDHDKIPQRS